MIETHEIWPWRQSTQEKKAPIPEESILIDGDAYFDALVSDINQAQLSVDLETYIFRKDSVGDRIAEALINAARRGINIRVLVDAAGTSNWSHSYATALESVGIQTKIFHPFPWQLTNWSRSALKAPLLIKWIYLFGKINTRNHRKVCIIDEKIAHVGSANIKNTHASKENGGENWRDTSVRVEKADLTDLQIAFEHAWNHHTIKERVRDAFQHVHRNPTFRVNYSRHRRRVLHKDLLKRLQRSVKRVWITNAYFVPDGFLLHRLIGAASRGVDVRILLGNTSDVLMMPWASCSFYESLLRRNIRIYEYLKSNLHAKTLIIDDWMLVGSSNLNHRSLLHDYEADVNVRTHDSKTRLEKVFLEDLNHAKEIYATSWKEDRPWWQRFIGKIVLYIKYWI